MEQITKQQIVDSYNLVRDCMVLEFELSQQEDVLKQAKIKAHNDTILAKQALVDLKN